MTRLWRHPELGPVCGRCLDPAERPRCGRITAQEAAACSVCGGTAAVDGIDDDVLQRLAVTTMFADEMIDVLFGLDFF